MKRHLQYACENRITVQKPVSERSGASHRRWSDKFNVVPTGTYAIPETEYRGGYENRSAFASDQMHDGNHDDRAQRGGRQRKQKAAAKNSQASEYPAAEKRTHQP